MYTGHWFICAQLTTHFFGPLFEGRSPIQHFDVKHGVFIGYE